MIIDKKGKLFGKISIIDILIVVVIIGAIAGFAYKITKSSTVTPFTKTDQLELYLITDDADSFVLNSIHEGDIVKDRASNVVLGTLQSIEYSDAKIQGINDSGEVVLSSRPDHISLRIKVIGSGLYSESSTSSIGNVNYYINRSMEVAVGDVILWLRIQEINKID